MNIHEHILNIHESKANKVLTKLALEFNSGSLGTQSKLLDYATKEYATFMNHLAEPFITPREMNKGDLLMLDSLVGPLQEVNDDLEISFNQLGRLRNSAKIMINLCASERKGLEQLVSTTTNTAASLKLWSSDSDVSFQWAGDTFTTEDKIDLPNTTARINTKSGVITLALEGEELLTPYISNVSIHPTFSNNVPEGLPGNNLEVVSVNYPANADDKNTPITPITKTSKQGDSSNPVYMFDGDSTTWFEWEKNVVPIYQKCVQRGHGLLNDESGDWWFVLSLNEGDKSVDSIPIPKKVKPDSVTDSYGDKVYGKPKTKDYGWTSYVLWPGSSQEEGPYKIVQTCKIEPRNQLSFTFTVEFAEAKDMSWIELSPYIQEKLPIELLQVEVKPETDMPWTKLLKQPIILNLDLNMPITNTEIPVKNLMGMAAIPCNIPKVKLIRFSLKQEKAYETRIAHKFYLKQTAITDVNKTWYGTTKATTTNYKNSRVSSETAPLRSSSTGGTANPMGSMVGAAVGYGVGQATQTTTTGLEQTGGNVVNTGQATGIEASILQDQAKAQPGYTGKLVSQTSSLFGLAVGQWATIGGIVGSLIGNKDEQYVQDTGITIGYDVFKAYRYAIGIRDIGLYHRLHTQFSQIQSKAHYFITPIKAVSLIVGEIIPDTWDRETEWIVYEVSPDGINWDKISPQEHELENAVVHFSNATSTVYVRATLYRPSDRPGETPTLNYYTLKAI